MGGVPAGEHVVCHHDPRLQVGPISITCSARLLLQPANSVGLPWLHCRFEERKKWFAASFIISILWIAFYSYWMVNTGAWGMCARMVSVCVYRCMFAWHGMALRMLRERVLV